MNSPPTSTNLSRDSGENVSRSCRDGNKSATTQVPSGISTKVWLALEHGLPTATTSDGTRGLPASARLAFSQQAPPWSPIHLDEAGGNNASGLAFAKQVARCYCSRETWEQHALAALALAKQLESRRQWSQDNAPLAVFLAEPPPLECAAPSAKSADAAQRDQQHQDSLLDAVSHRFVQLHARAGGCDNLARTFPP